MALWKIPNGEDVGGFHQYPLPNCQPCQCITLEKDPPAPVEPSDDSSPSCDLKRDPEPELLNQAAP